MRRTIIRSAQVYPAGGVVVPANSRRVALVFSLQGVDISQSLAVGSPKPTHQCDIVFSSPACPLTLSISVHGDIVTRAIYAPSEANTSFLIVWEIIEEPLYEETNI